MSLLPIAFAYNQEPKYYLDASGEKIASFIDHSSGNIDWETVESFGEEWTKFSNFSDLELSQIGKDYFDIVSEKMLNSRSRVLDVGCGTGRWTKYVCSRAGFVEAIDPSKAVLVAEQMLSSNDNVRITQAEVDNIPFEDNSFDFVFSLGVLHHIPDTKAAMRKCVQKLKPDGHFLVYLYYNFENRGMIFRSIFHLSSLVRSSVCKLPSGAKKFVCDLLAFSAYLPLALLSKALKPVIGNGIKKLPLSYYHDKTFNVMRNDALDRFGTPLEQRFSKAEISEMMTSSGLTDIRFSATEPYWHAVGRKSGNSSDCE